MKPERRLATRTVCAVILALGCAVTARAQDPDCAGCHGDLVSRKVVHAAAQAGCRTCHDRLDASTVPHTSKGSAPKGLSAESPALCSNCHDRKLFEGKIIHAPVAAGMCSACHDPHSSDSVGLLKKEPAVLCLDCHADVKKTPHVIVGFSGGGHPLGDTGRAKEVADPLRSGKPFYCAACHEPHRSELPKLSRFDKGMGACQKCHNK